MPKEYSFERYLNVRLANGASFAPDGESVSFLSDITGVAEVWSVPVALETESPAWPEQLTFRGERVSGAHFSPDERVLLVSGDVGGNELTQLYTLSADGSEFTPLTNRPESMYLFGDWSPDGKCIAYSSNERDSRYYDIYERDMASGETKLLLQSNNNNYVHCYSPDGKRLLITRMESFTRMQLILLDISSGEAQALTPLVSDEHAQYSHAAWSADRKGLYLLSNRGRQFLSLAYLDLVSTELTYLKDISWDVEALAATHDGTALALVVNEDGYSRLEILDVTSGWEARQELPVPQLPKGVIVDLTWSKDGNRLAITCIASNDVSNVWVWDRRSNRLKRLTQSATGGIPRSSFVLPKLIRYPTFDGREIPAFLYLPQDQASKDLPVVITVHGGPEGQYRPTFDTVTQYLVAHGYAVLAPNVRGSTGYGYEYQSLDDVRLRVDSVADLRHAVLWLRESGIADPRRIAVMGGSYGGFMVLSSITTYPDLWAAAVDIVGIANFVTFLENTGPWRRKLREAEYGSLENDREFLEQISPINAVDKITAPLFVVHGANDPRVPVGEAEQIVAALREREVPVEYLRFADEGHGLVKRANRLAAYPAIARFLDQHLRSEK